MRIESAIKDLVDGTISEKTSFKFHELEEEIGELHRCFDEMGIPPALRLGQRLTLFMQQKPEFKTTQSKQP